MALHVLPTAYLLTFVPVNEQIALMSIPTIQHHGSRKTANPGTRNRDPLDSLGPGLSIHPPATPGFGPGGRDPQDAVDIIEVMERPERALLHPRGSTEGKGSAPGEPIPVRGGMIPLEHMPRFIAAWNAGHATLVADLDAASEAVCDGTASLPRRGRDDGLDETLQGVESA